MSAYIGLDVYSEHTFATVLDHSGRVVAQRRIMNEHVPNFLRLFNVEKVGVEASTHVAPLYRSLTLPFTPIVGIVASLLLILFIEDAGVLILGAELAILALLVYYIKMAGYARIRSAFGGISLGIGSLGMLVAYLIKSGLVSLPLESEDIFTYGLIFVSAVYILAGILNSTTKP